jgi:shikimate dehydrogenase
MITGRARIAGVMGWPVAHSRSPRLHAYWLEEHEIDGAYVPFPVKPSDLERALKALPILGIVGCNLTIPHKEAALSVLDEVDDSVRLVGAVNTVIVGADGKLRGMNTDIAGFCGAVREAMPGFTGRRAVVLGAGGAARAVLGGLAELGVKEVRLTNRTHARAETLAKTLDKLPLTVGVVPWAARSAALDGADILINATSLGMEGEPPLELALDRLPKGALVFDAVYVPLDTALLKAARARRNPVADGLSMLLHQARPAFAAWFGTEPKVTPGLRAHVLQSLKR